MVRPLTDRERSVLDALLSVDFDGVEDFRREATSAVVVGGCGCGCPSIDFYNEQGQGMEVLVNASVEGRQYDGLFLYAVAGRLGGIEWVGGSGESDPAELPPPSSLKIAPASPIG